MKDTPAQFIERCQRMADNLVERGFASRVLFDHNIERVRFVWTDRGEFLQSSLKDLFREFVAPDKEIDSLTRWRRCACF
jgi:hypothetical protein